MKAMNIKFISLVFQIKKPTDFSRPSSRNLEGIKSNDNLSKINRNNIVFVLCNDFKKRIFPLNLKQNSGKIQPNVRYQIPQI